ncbi:MAG TPA: GyrI-like domain-containing protein [Anaerolineae bacterium]|nr:GyrI-like domain-containing protein [Anaerolineae bacterium]
MPTIDLRTQFKHLYQPSAKKFSSVDVPPMNFLMIDGTGNPNTSQDFKDAMEALYGLSYTLKFGVKLGKYGKRKYDYPVMALEGLWWMDDMREFSVERKDEWKWTVMIMQPDIITPDLVELARADLIKKKHPAAAPKIRFECYAEGPSAQIMYIGPFADEGPTIQRLHDFIHESGHQLRGKHHEIYISDPRRTAPEKLKTVIRQPMK